MSHSHNNCDNSRFGICTEGRVTFYCGDDHCFDEFCADLGHCECKCHSGKTCNCGYQWKRMEKMADDKNKAEEQKRKDDADDSNYAAGGAVR